MEQRQGSEIQRHGFGHTDLQMAAILGGQPVCRWRRRPSGPSGPMAIATRRALFRTPRDRHAWYETEQWPKGGDELNVIKKGAQLMAGRKLTYGVNYATADHHERDRTEGNGTPMTIGCRRIAPSAEPKLNRAMSSRLEGRLFTAAA